MPEQEAKASEAPIPNGSEALPSAVAPSPLSANPTLLLALAILFAGSGCAALVYEIVWFQMLQLVIGSTAVALAALLTTFMGGMCLGSVFLPEYIPFRVHPLRAWAFLEFSIGLCGLIILGVVPALEQFYAVVAPGGIGGTLLRGAICALCLLPPTLLMGATLPTVARLTGTTRAGSSQVGLIYAANTLGAVFGALLAGFYLLRIWNVSTATCVAAGLNGIIAIIGLGLPVAPSNSGPVTMNQSDLREPLCWSVHVTIAISGLCALSAEVVWTRLLSLMLGGTTYTFSIILAVFLLGLGVGGGAGALLARWVRNPGVGLGICQFLLVPAISWAATMLGRSLPYWPINPSLAKNIWVVFQLDLVRCAYAILPATCLWGASFPLALAAIVRPGENAGRLVGRLYAANTIGAILGAVGTSILLIAWLGTQQTQRVLMVLSALAGCLIVRQFALGRGENGLIMRRTPVVIKTTRWLAVAGAAALLVWCVPRLPWPLVAYGRYLPTKTELGAVLYQGEGMNASVAVTELDSGVRNFHISGKIEASTEQQDMRLQRMLGHIPALFHPDPRSVLVVGCGAGVTAGSFLTHPGIEKVTVCEIEPLIPKVVARYFGEENYDVVNAPRVRLVYDDARHYILTTREKFDVITSDPIHPWVKGAATLYTKEYFELCKRHLNLGGMVSQWVPLYESNVAAVKSEIATFFEVFPEGTLWSNDDQGAGYDLVLLGQADPLEVEVETMQQRLSRSDHQRVAQSLRDVGIRSAFSLVATYGGQAHDLKPWLKSAEINRDRDLRLQYLAGLGLNLDQSDAIYTQIISYRRFPEGIFPGSNIWNDSLRRIFLPAQPKKETNSPLKNQPVSLGVSVTNRTTQGGTARHASPP